MFCLSGEINNKLISLNITEQLNKYIRDKFKTMDTIKQKGLCGNEIKQKKQTTDIRIK